MPTQVAQPRLVPLYLTPLPLPTANPVMRDGISSGTICVKADDAAEGHPHEARAAVYRADELLDPMPDDPDLLPPHLLARVVPGQTGDFFENGHLYNIRFLCEHRCDVPLAVGSPQTDNYLCLWARRHQWLLFPILQFHATLAETNNCDETR